MPEWSRCAYLVRDGRCLGLSDSSFNRREQQDAQEFLGLFLDQVQLWISSEVVEAAVP